jgi:hypothetical protein
LPCHPARDHKRTINPNGSNAKGENELQSSAGAGVR